ncbi:DUF2971 domain-containing protein [Photobacterium kishitanii]|uniref:DUF2971 domain-containing protein n=1 Tax=Photobacterium kishitanii TaxID=318456 RepID=UPI000D179D64|nr:DUF2971 domain-containing protein [Photobacterium kishitanii]PSU85247.1 DUF2971 domain-containing protein [Photobacterium kishitanii]
MHLYKYRCFEMNHLKALVNNQIWFSRGKFFNDPFDCTTDVPITFVDSAGIKRFIEHKTKARKFVDYGLLTESDLTQIQNKYLNDLEKLVKEGRYKDHDLGWLVDAVFTQLERSFVHCLSSTPKNNLMWSHYANSHTGFCIRYKKDILLDNQEIYKYGNVNYDGKPLSLIEQLIEPEKINAGTEVIFKKSKEWIYEQEFRLVHKDMAEKQTDNFRILEHSDNAIDCIIFGMKADKDNIHLLKTMLNGRDIIFKQIKRSSKGFEIFVDPERI